MDSSQFRFQGIYHIQGENRWEWARSHLLMPYSPLVSPPITEQLQPVVLVHQDDRFPFGVGPHVWSAKPSLEVFREASKHGVVVLWEPPLKIPLTWYAPLRATRSFLLGPHVDCPWIRRRWEPEQIPEALLA